MPEPQILSWPKLSLLDDPDEEERARRQLNESRRRRGLPPLYPDSGFPAAPDFTRLPVDSESLHPDLFRGNRGVAHAESRNTEPAFRESEPETISKAEVGSQDGRFSLFAQAEPGSRPADGPASDTQNAPAASPPRGQPLSYERIRELVHRNNRSRLPDEMIIAIIFKESSFIPTARNKSGASGLMQMKEIAWTEVHRKVLQQSDVPDFTRHVFDPATNIQRGSAYLQYQIDRRGGDAVRGLFRYGPGRREPGYPDDVLAATEALRQNPENPIAVLSRIYRRQYP